MILALFLALRQRQSQNLHGSRRHKSRLCEHKKERQNTKEQDSKPARRVRVLYCPPSHPNTLDQRAKSPVISRCSGFFMTENFQSIPWLNGNATEVRTGFEPLFFHIQAEFQWQRPFSEGCGGWISEKLKKNLSQSYGRWIVGFHEPMTSAFFALKKGAGIGGMNMSKEQTAKKERFLREVERQLLRKGLDSEMMEDGIPTMK